MTHDWFIVRNGKEHGPFTASQLKQLAANGKLQPSDSVRRSDRQSATKAGSIKGLFQTQAPHTPAPDPVTTEYMPARRTKRTLTHKLLMGALVASVASVVVCCGGGLVFIGGFAIVGHRQLNKELDEADALWQAGNKDKAVMLYQASRQSPFLDSHNEHSSLVYGRLIDFEYEKGNRDAGKMLINEAARKHIIPAVSHTEATTVIAVVVAQSEAADANFTMAQQVRYIANNNFGLTCDEAEAVLHPGAEVNGLLYDEKVNKELVGGKLVASELKTGTIRKSGQDLKLLIVGPHKTDRPDPKIDYSERRIHSIKSLVRDGATYHTKTRWDFLDVTGTYSRVLKHPNEITDYDGTSWQIEERQVKFYLNGQKQYECYGKRGSGMIDDRCYDKRNRYWDESGKELDHKTYCELVWGKEWWKEFLASESRAGRRHVENVLQSMKRHGMMTEEQCQQIIKDMESAGTIPRR